MRNIIVAVTLDGAIGKDGDQLYYISDDLKRFKSLTKGNTVIMGRKTFEALPKGALPDRKNIVVSGSGFTAPDVTTVTSPDEAFAEAEGEAFVIGGGRIYNDCLPLCDTVYLTEIDVSRPDADTFFPSLDPLEWRIVEKSDWKTDDKTNVRFRYLKYSRRK